MKLIDFRERAPESVNAGSVNLESARSEGMTREAWELMLQVTDGISKKTDAREPYDEQKLSARELGEYLGLRGQSPDEWEARERYGRLETLYRNWLRQRGTDLADHEKLQFPELEKKTAGTEFIGYRREVESRYREDFDIKLKNLIDLAEKEPKSINEIRDFLEKDALSHTNVVRRDEQKLSTKELEENFAFYHGKWDDKVDHARGEDLFEDWLERRGEDVADYKKSQLLESERKDALADLHEMRAEIRERTETGKAILVVDLEDAESRLFLANKLCYANKEDVRGKYQKDFDAKLKTIIDSADKEPKSIKEIRNFLERDALLHQDVVRRGQEQAGPVNDRDLVKQRSNHQDRQPQRETRAPEKSKGMER